MRTLVTLGVVIVALFGALFAGARWSDGSLAPKLALDLEGGTQLILQPVTAERQQVTDEDITQAIDIIRQRVDASGVVRGGDHQPGLGQERNIVVALPGTPTQETLDLVRQSAQMFFRPVLTAPTTPAASSTPDNAAANLGTRTEHLRPARG